MASRVGVVFVVLAIAGCLAEPVQFRSKSRRNQFFARQEEAPSSSPAPAPYPPAGVTPEIVFELPTEQTTVQPDNTYLPPAPEPTPDNTYGPPADTYGPPEQTYGPPDNKYGPPAAPEQPASGDQPADEPQAERIIFRPRNRQLSAPLRQQRQRLQPLKFSRLQFKPIEIIRSQPVIAYSVQYKSF